MACRSLADNDGMQATLLRRPLSPAARNQVIESIAYVCLAFIYTLDVITPPDLSLEVAYEVPVAISGLTGGRRIFVRVAFAAAVTNVLGYISDGVLSTFNDPIALQNRLISLASLTLVCTLMIIVQRATDHNTALEEQHKQYLIERELASEVRRRHEALAARQHVIDDLVEAIAHDVRTPLAALSLTLKQALRGQYGELPQEYREVARESRTSIDDISRLADSLLAVARLESGAAPPPRVAVDVTQLSHDLANEFAQLANTREVTLEPVVPGGVIVRGSEAELRRAIGNLVANAIRHTPPGGRITLAAQRSDIGWRIDVCDDGVGVAESAAPTLFERYAHGDGGTGLGLYFVKRIAEGLGGAASYAARTPLGSRFSMDIPAWQR